MRLCPYDVYRYNMMNINTVSLYSAYVKYCEALVNGTGRQITFVIVKIHNK